MDETKKTKPFLLAIAGGTASGKGLFAKMLSEKFPGESAIVCMDMYYKDQSHLPLAERFAANMDCPEALDLELFRRHLGQLRAGTAVEVPVYEFSDHTRASQKFPPTGGQKLIIIEGLLTLADPSLLPYYDLKIFLEADADLRLARRLLRDLKDKRYETPEESINQYLTSARPNHKIYVEPQKAVADLVIDWNEINLPALENIVLAIRQKLV